MKRKRKKLLDFEIKEEFVFHGSPLLLKELVPKQPMIFNKKTRKAEKHGNPCIAATQFTEIAIFRAIINSKNFPIRNYSSSFGINIQGKKEFTVTHEVFEKLKKRKTGYIYVFLKNNFSKFSGMEYRSSRNLKPLEVISVSTKFLPKNIQIREIR